MSKQQVCRHEHPMCINGWLWCLWCNAVRRADADWQRWRVAMSVDDALRIIGLNQNGVPVEE